MDLRQLEYLVAVAEEGTFTRAAERVHISQSGISAQIRRLEQTLGAELLDRSGRTVTLTPAGAAALSHARAALAEAAALRQAVGEVTGLLRGRLTVGMVVACTVAPLFDALAAFHRAHPGVEIVLHEDNSDRLIDAVRAGATDLALVGTADSPPPDLARHELVRERLVAIPPPRHPLDGRAEVTLAELLTYPLICLPPGTGIRTVLDRAIGHPPPRALQATAPGAILDLAARGLGVGVLSESMADGVVITGVPDPAMLALVWRAPVTAAVRAFLQHFQGVRHAPVSADHG